MTAATVTAAAERATGAVHGIRDRVRRLAPDTELYAESAGLLRVLGVAAVAFVALFPLFGSTIWVLRLEQGLYFGLVVLGLNLLLGSAGMVSFGQAMFMGIGAYAIAIPWRDHGIDPVYLLPLSAAAGALAALLVGLLIIRSRALYFSLLTLGIAQLFWAVEHGWQSFTGGTNGISGIFLSGWLNGITNQNNLFWFIFGCTLICTIVMYVITVSPFGDALRAIRDNPRRAEFTGMWVRRYELTAFVIAGTFGAIGGGLWVFADAGLTSDTVDWRKSAIALIAALIGGTRYFLGPFVGAIFWIYFRDQVVQFSGELGLLWDTILGAIVVFVALVAPGGIVGLVHTALAYLVGLWRRLFHKPRESAEPVVAEKREADVVGIWRRLFGKPVEPTAPPAGVDPDAVHLPKVVPLPDPAAAAPATQDGRQPLLELKNLTKRFGGLVAVDDVSLSVRQGTIHAIIGPNGAGKSTLFNLVTGLHKPDAGQVVLEGEDVTGKPAWQLVKRGMGRSFQQTNLFWTLEASKNVTVAGSAVGDATLRPFGRHPKAIRDRGRTLLERVGLEDFGAFPANQLSHGDQRSLEIATALAVNSRLLLLDEPTAGLAGNETTTAVELIRRIAREENLTVLFVEHDMEVVFGIADYITVLHKGAVLAQGTPAEIRADETVREAYLGGDELLAVEES
jgi:ABC-type branched-subunit amino acid transport system ATPase component/ABC-type branched-subunit amino acid transport system permease subunit